ncbi:hypothetical protein [Micromonospora zhanjiangensis]
MLAVAAAGPLDALKRARLELLRAQIGFHLTRDSDVPGRLLDAAKMLAPLDTALSRETYLHALDAAVINGGDDATHIAAAALAAPPAEVPARPVDLLLDGLATTLTGDTRREHPGYGAPLKRFATARTQILGGTVTATAGCGWPAAAQ